MRNPKTVTRAGREKFPGPAPSAETRRAAAAALLARTDLRRDYCGIGLSLSSASDAVTKPYFE